MRFASAHRALGLARTDDLIAAAHAALDDGVYAPGLGELITRPDIQWADADRWFAEALAELDETDPTPQDALRTVLAAHLRPLAERAGDPVAAFDRLATDVARPLRAQEPVGLDFGPIGYLLRYDFPFLEPLDAGEVPPEERRRRTERVVQAARMWCEGDRWPTGWLTPTVLDLAAAIESGVRFDRLPVLADALEEAGCDDPSVLAHCRDGSPHGDWCWAVASVLGPDRERVSSALRPAAWVRRRPGMYIGNTDAHGLHHMLYALIAGSTAEADLGFGSVVRVTHLPGGAVTVADDGRGVPLDSDGPGLGARLSRFAWPEASPPDRSLFDHAVAIALSEWSHVESRADGRWVRAEFREGVAVAVREIGPAGGNGLAITLLPDPAIFGAARVDPVAVRDRLQRAAFIYPGVAFEWTDTTTESTELFRSDDGAADHVRWLTADREPLHPDVIVARGAAAGVRYDVAFRWSVAEYDDQPQWTVLGYVNGEAVHSGTHLTGFWAAVSRSVNTALRRQGRPPLTRGDVRVELDAVVSVRLADPRWQGSFRDHLDSPEVRTVVQAAVGRVLRDRLRANPALARAIAANAGRG